LGDKIKQDLGKTSEIFDNRLPPGLLKCKPFILRNSVTDTGIVVCLALYGESAWQVMI